MWRLMSNPYWMIVSTYLSTRQIEVGCSQQTADSIWWDGWLIFQFLCRFSTEEVEICKQSRTFWWFLPTSLWKPASQIHCWMNHQDSTLAGWNQSMLCETFRSASYVVDVCNLQNQDDIKKDEFGIWNYSGLQSVPQRRWLHDSRKMLWRCIWS